MNQRPTPTWSLQVESQLQRLREQDAAARERVWRRLQAEPLAHLAPPPRRRRGVLGELHLWPHGFAFAFAASLAAAVLAIFSASSTDNLSADIERTFQLSDKDSQEVQLADGSSLSLTRGAEGRLTESRARRDVHFDLTTGKVGFEVKPEAKKRWTVKAGAYEVLVIGTRFVVHHEPGAQRTTVQVERGIVQVSNRRLGEGVRLLAGDELVGTLDRIEVRRANRPTEAGPLAPPVESQLNDDPSEPSRDSASAPSGAGRDEPRGFRALYAQGDYRRALAAVREQGAERLLRELDPHGLWVLADTGRLGGSPALAQRAWLTLRERFPRSNEAARAAFMLGRAADQRGDSRTAERYLTAYLGERPFGVYAAESTGRLMQLYRKSGRQSEARKMATRYLQLAPKGAYRDVARSLSSPP